VFQEGYLSARSSPEHQGKPKEKKCNEQGALTQPQIRAAVKAVWALVTKGDCEMAVRKAKKVLQKSIVLKGGN
jgi:ribosomal protein S21